MEKVRNVILCGFMATGKSTVGKRLAELVGFDFIDLDIAIETEEGVSIPQIFAERGEPAFRALESRMVEKMMDQSGFVIATGGGTIVNPRNLANLKKCGIVVALTADIPTILHRTATDTHRPLLLAQSEEGREVKIRALLEQRMSAYSQTDIMLDTSSLTIEEVAQKLSTMIFQGKPQ